MSDDDYKLVPLRDLKLKYNAKPEFLVDGYIEQGALVLVPGPPDTFKSWALFDLCRAVTQGGLWLEHFPVKPGPAIYVEQERARNLVYQAGLIEQGHQCDLGDLLVAPPSGISLRDPLWQQRIISLVTRHAPVLVVINSFRSVFRGRAGDGSDIHDALGWLGTLAEQASTTIIVVDQLNKPGIRGAVRGAEAHADSAQKEYEADAVLHIERDRDPVGRGTGPARVYVGKFRSGEPGPPFAFEVRDQEAGGVRLVYLGETTVERPQQPQLGNARDKVLNALPIAGAKSLETLARETQLEIGTVKNQLAALKRDGRALNVERGQWRKIVIIVTDPKASDDDDDAEGPPDTPCPLCEGYDLVPSPEGSGWVCGKLMDRDSGNGDARRE